MTKYIVSCSGGVDSVVLAHYLKSQNKLHSIYHFVYNDPIEFTIEALKHVTQLSLSLEVHLHLAYEDSKKSSNNNEANWRLQRYQALKVVTEDDKCQVAVGHHMDDQKTSYVLSLLKNSDRCFIPPLNIIEENTVIRPFILLGWDKQKILEYAEEHKLRYVEDPFNMVGDRGTIDLILPDLNQIKQFEDIFRKKYESWWNKNQYDVLEI